MAKHVMLDLETYGTKPGCIILSIGAVTFDIDGLYEEFYEVLDLKSSKAWGFKEEFSTVKWWSKQSLEARKAVFESGGDVLPDRGIKDFSSWVEKVNGKSLWANGADFDIPILQAYYEEMGVVWPFHFVNDRCFRTLRTMCPIQQIEENLCEHNALEDAKWQARYAVKCLEWLRWVQSFPRIL